MTARLSVFDVPVLVKNKNFKEYRSSLGIWCNEEIWQVKHIYARTGEQAVKKAEKYGRPSGYSKHHATDKLQNIEHIKLDQILQDGIYQIESPRNNLLAEDEFIWNKQQKKRENMSKDKVRINKGLADIIEI